MGTGENTERGDFDEPAVGVDSSGTKLYYHCNQQYSIVALTDGSGGIVERYDYTAYGEPTILSGSGSPQSFATHKNRYTYTGREWDETLELYHYRARMYSPEVGRFVSRDPIAYLGSFFNLFEYAQSKPLVGTDAYGLRCTITVTMGHSGEVDRHLDKNRKKYGKCDLFAPICCFMDGKVKKCVENNGPDSVVPDWPENDFLVWCSDVPKILEDAWKPTSAALKGMCGKDGCGCKSATVSYKYSPAMKKCTAKLKAAGKLGNDPCGGDSTYDCETKKFSHDY